MNKKHEQRRRDIKSKLTAAICMLLVSSIMMVSSTYAWFTLSTAPEVTGITTAVGANGNLEMALLPYGQTTVAESAVGDGAVTSVTVKNKTWGNLVDVSKGYGLDQITLLPAALNTAEGNTGKVNTAAFLKYPKYGADGRASEFDTGTSAFAYNASATELVPDVGFIQTAEQNGVRGIGVNSGLTPRQIAFRNALGAGDSYRENAIRLAQNALEANGDALGSIAVKKALDGDTATYTQADVEALTAMATALNGALDEIEKSYMQYILAFAASKNEQPDVAYSTVQGWIAEDGATLSSVLAKFTSAESLGFTITVPSQISTAAGSLATTKSNVTTAIAELKAISEYTWDKISVPLKKLADPDQMKINGHTMEEVKADISIIIADISNGVKISMVDGAGAFADVAKHCGNYTANINVSITHSNLGPNPVSIPATMTAVGVNTLGTYHTGIQGNAPESKSDAARPLSDMYGYIIDMVFRTNAAGSRLKLQAEGVDRIYDGNQNEDTMGHGATMTFAGSAGFTNEQVIELMKAIRIVFFNPADGTIIKHAKLDMGSTTPDEATTPVPNYSIGVDGVTAKIKLYTQTTGEDNQVTETASTDDVIMSLGQNTLEKLSVLVYLDGNLVTNSHVATTGAKSMTGKMNLQFSSTATLVPMEYANLHQTGTATGSTTPSATTDSTVPSGSEASDETLDGPNI